MKIKLLTSWNLWHWWTNQLIIEKKNIYGYEFFANSFFYFTPNGDLNVSVKPDLIVNFILIRPSLYNCMGGRTLCQPTHFLLWEVNQPGWPFRLRYGFEMFKVLDHKTSWQHEWPYINSKSYVFLDFFRKEYM